MVAGRGRRLHRRGCRDLRSEGIRVAFENLSYGLLANLLVLLVVAATVAVAITTILATRETLAVKLKAPGILAIAILPDVLV